jgi:hypothetical protein
MQTAPVEHFKDMRKYLLIYADPRYPEFQWMLISCQFYPDLDPVIFLFRIGIFDGIRYDIPENLIDPYPVIDKFAAGDPDRLINLVMIFHVIQFIKTFRDDLLKLDLFKLNFVFDTLEWLRISRIKRSRL